MFVANIYTNQYHLERRRVEPLFSNKFNLNLITNHMSDKEVDALQDGVWLLKTEKELKLQDGKWSRICKPVRFLGEKSEFCQQPYLYDILEFSFGEDTEEKLQDIETKILLSHRIAYQTNQNPENIWGYLKERITTGTVSMETLSQWAKTPVSIDWNKARLIPREFPVRCGGDSPGIYFGDFDSCETAKFFITGHSLEKYRVLIPDYIQIIKKDDYTITCEVLLDKVAAIKDAMYLPSPDSSILEDLQIADGFSLDIAPYPDQPNITFDALIKKDSINFQAILKRHGLKEFDGQYIPEGYPDWFLGEIKDNDMVKVRFTNGLTGRYPLSYMMKRYPGKCLNAKSIAKVYSFETMRVIVVQN